ncbi:hypothetical protein [Longimicrobium terrae]|uniref:Uncharacterized protein n=1 Tax=Longimicrobium terrae TaxID=1639882 RepID=A0A841H1U2_9BACT|nr:hypothetical protein [Longimicrobium terrae]MBB4637509.1 hypothetical protein [Longimicrobium terrae]MBB6071906.1 hypothetical protein [Longimicrobium terrae]NNC30454.1 hypothetical protein [Longimicrobium terrae]
MTESDIPGTEALEKSFFAQLMGDSLSLERLISAGQLATETSPTDAEIIHANAGRTDEPVSARAAAVARLAIEAKRQAPPHGTA